MGETPVNPARAAQSEAKAAMQPGAETRRRLIEQQVQQGQQFQQRQTAQREAGQATAAPQPQPQPQEDTQTSGTKDITLGTAMSRLEGAEDAIEKATTSIEGLVGKMGAGAAGGG